MRLECVDDVEEEAGGFMGSDKIVLKLGRAAKSE
jgi:hypothetical protein